MTALRSLLRSLRLPKPTRTLTTTSALSRSIADSAKEAVKTIDRVAGNAALKGIETGEAIAGAAKQTVSGTTARARGVGSGVAGKAKSTAAEAAGKAREVGGKAGRHQGGGEEG
ncbi:hypothetical protein HOY82DRAFT_63491 [Tuber indicum]|nr:hypothetical protein HOY82DRAFT_63491 [Tuber indicum]